VVCQKLKKKGKKKRKICKISLELFNLLRSNEYIVEAFPSSLNHEFIRDRFIVGHKFAGLFLFKLSMNDTLKHNKDQN